MSTYQAASGAVSLDDPIVLKLYAWNARVSGEFMAPLHLCEVVIRNAVCEGIEAVYGPMWPWSVGFEQSLPYPPKGYNPRRDLQQARQGMNTAGKVIPELKFVFWQKMFTSRYDVRLWNTYLRQIFPNADQQKTIGQIRTDIYSELETIRGLRNRIAHHEPIIARQLDVDFDKIHALIEIRCTRSAAWMLETTGRVRTTIKNRP